MYKIYFTDHGKRDLEKLPRNIRLRIVAKLQFFSKISQPLIFSKPLINLPPATHRFRVGEYRIAFYISENCLYIEKIKHRKDVYKD